jgi:hypothetical protein
MPPYDAAVFASVDELAHVDADYDPKVGLTVFSVPQLDTIDATRTYKKVVRFLQNLGLRTTDEFWNTGAPVEESMFASRFVNTINHVFGRDVGKPKGEGPMTLFFYYTGHGREDGVSEEELAIPRLRNNHLSIFAELRGRVMPLMAQKGDWILHELGHFGIGALLETIVDGAKEIHMRDTEFVIVTDCCYSGNWCDVLKKVAPDLKSRLERNGCVECDITIQSSTGTEQEAYGIEFIDAFLAIQDEVQRNAWIDDFQILRAAGTLECVVKSGRARQTALFASTKSSADPFVRKVENLGWWGNGKPCVYLFTNPDFYCFCRSRLDDIKCSQMWLNLFA